MHRRQATAEGVRQEVKAPSLSARNRGRGEKRVNATKSCDASGVSCSFRLRGWANPRAGTAGYRTSTLPTAAVQGQADDLPSTSSAKAELTSHQTVRLPPQPRISEGTCSQYEPAGVSRHNPPATNMPQWPGPAFFVAGLCLVATGSGCFTSHAGGSERLGRVSPGYPGSSRNRVRSSFVSGSSQPVGHVSANRRSCF